MARTPCAEAQHCSINVATPATSSAVSICVVRCESNSMSLVVRSCAVSVSCFHSCKGPIYCVHSCQLFVLFNQFSKCVSLSAVVLLKDILPGPDVTCLFPAVVNCFNFSSQ